MKEFPCNSASFSLGIPDRRCRPSTFYDQGKICFKKLIQNEKPNFCPIMTIFYGMQYAMSETSDGNILRAEYRNKQ